MDNPCTKYIGFCLLLYSLFHPSKIIQSKDNIKLPELILSKERNTKTVETDTNYNVSQSIDAVCGGGWPEN